MTHINKINRMLLYTVLLVVGFATAAFSDSFVDQSAMSALNGFTFGQTVSTVGTTGYAKVYTNTGDSFINGLDMQTLKDFRFGMTDDTPITAHKAMTDKYTSPVGISDSFVNMESLKRYEHVSNNESEHRGNCGFNC